MATDMY